ncbi:MAG TPA: DUF4965 domain-containing protein [Tepidisphaeraceae bacterium]|jgi:hypothetical protein
MRQILLLVLAMVLGAVVAEGAEPILGRPMRRAAAGWKVDGVVNWKYTTEKPAEGWEKPDFDDGPWKQGRGGFGVNDTPGARVGTHWNTSDIWMRREFVWEEKSSENIKLLMHHDEDAEVYINGILAVKEPGYVDSYRAFVIAPEALKALRAGEKNVMAVHCHQTKGGQFIDASLVREEKLANGQYYPPAVPLVVHDPYLSIWSFRDELGDDSPRHWTGKREDLLSTIRVDGQTYLLMGQTKAAKMEQTSVEVSPTKTVYQFAGGGVKVGMTFLTPALLDDVELLARPITYVTWEISSTDEKTHQVELELNDGRTIGGGESVVTDSTVAGLKVTKRGPGEQKVLGRAGDRVAIDWGYAFVASEGFPLKFEVDQKITTHTAMVGLDEVYAIELMGKRLRPYWRKNFDSVEDLVSRAKDEYERVKERCSKFDAEFMDDLRNAGGETYGRIGALAYRQAIAGCGLAADEQGRVLMFPKENTSNGCIATVDVHYPFCPILVLLNPSLLEANLTPVFDYAESARWKFDFAPHDLGTYPKANGQVYGGGEKTEENQMPVEESGNMILMTAAVAKARGNADYAVKHWDALTKWAAYLRNKGFDPENQLCTDDFMGHLAHNVNLSAKTIVSLGAYGMMCEMTGKKDEASAYRKLAEGMAKKWVEQADDGGHSKLAFDKPGTWSQKYNLVWDQVLGLNLFPKDVIARELKFYQTKQDPYGVPLDSRKSLTKTDWLVWTASMSDSKEQFEELINPIGKFMAESQTRVPFSDLYMTKSAEAWLHTRPVIGGVYMRLLTDEKVWKKWADRSR